MLTRKDIYSFVDTFSRYDYNSMSFTPRELISIINNFILAIKFLDDEKTFLKAEIEAKKEEILNLLEKVEQMKIETDNLHNDYNKIYSKKLSLKQRMTGKL